MKNALRSASMISLLGIFLLLSGCSVQDHVIPEELTIATEVVKTGDGFNFEIRADKLGDLPVTEHGILYLAFFRASGDTDYIPRIEHGGRIKFDTPLVLGLNKFKDNGDAFFGRYFFYYRAYAIKSDGSVAYGEIRNYTF
jgi:hypothetical protein